MGIKVGNVLGLFVLLVDVWILANVTQSRAVIGVQAAWIAPTLLLPVLGLLIPLTAGPRG